MSQGQILSIGFTQIQKCNGHKVDVAFVIASTFHHNAFALNRSPRMGRRVVFEPQPYS